MSGSSAHPHPGWLGIGKRAMGMTGVCCNRRFDEGAIKVLVERHGPMVLSLCRRVLRDPHDAEDAFQATFLVLIRRAGELKEWDTLGPWLFGVARRTAQRARSSRIRRDEHERRVVEEDEDRDVPLPDDPLRGMIDEEDIRVLREEVNRLPAEYRAPIVLCDLQGLTRQEAARQLGWPAGTVGSRVARGRRLLRARLIRRGLAPAPAPVPASAPSAIRQEDRG
jgi:polysaccharide export outer membrane protein